MPRTTLALDSAVIDQLMPDLVGHDHKPSAFIVFLYLWRRTRTLGKARHRIPVREIVEETGLSKRTVQSMISHLEKRRLIAVERETITAVPRYHVLWPTRNHA